LGPTHFDDPVPNPLVGVKPLLVVLMEFTDLAHDPDVTAAFIQNQVHGPRPSVNDFYLEMSYGQYSFSDAGHWSWIMAWDDPATTEDESSRAYWDSYNANDTVYHGGVFQHHGLRSLEAAGYAFAPLDTNPDGKIVFAPEVTSPLTAATLPGHRGGAMRGMPEGYTFDGKEIKGVSCGVAGDSPWITIYAHELGHQSSWGGPWFFEDYYGIEPENIGMFSLMGWSGTSGWAGPIGPHHLDTLTKMKNGWFTPTAVTADGWFDIQDAETHKAAYVLYDPDHGKNEYFIVENRWKGTSYDNTSVLIGPLDPPMPPAQEALDIPDEGLLVWHVDELRQWDGRLTEGFAKVRLIHRGGAYETATFDGSDPGNYDFYDGSSPENATWNGGANSKTGVWCVSPAGPTMRAFLDVPGPGVLICAGPLETAAIPGHAGTITVPLRNTGDVADTFAISVVGPSDVTATPPAPVTIGPKTAASVDVLLTPIRACTTAPGPRTATITATSLADPSVTDSVTATLQVLPFGDPEASVAAIDDDVMPSESGTFGVGLVNQGNVFDTITLTFTGIDFGTAYLADPTAIPSSWVSFMPEGPSAPACGSTGSVLTITVPMDWVGMEDAVYEFIVTGTSSLTPTESGSATDQLTVRATPLSMMLYVEKECKDLIDAVLGLPPSDVRDGLYDKANATCAKIRQGIDRFLAGDDPPAGNHFATSQNMLGAFLHLLDAQRGKALMDAEADALEAMVLAILGHIDTVLTAI